MLPETQIKEALRSYLAALWQILRLIFNDLRQIEQHTQHLAAQPDSF